MYQSENTTKYGNISDHENTKRTTSGRHPRRPLLSSNVMMSLPLAGSLCVSGSRGQLSGHGPPEQEHARVWTADPPGVKGEWGGGA